MNKIYDIDSKFIKILNAINSNIMIINQETCEVLFLNDKFKNEILYREHITNCKDIFGKQNNELCKKCKSENQNDFRYKIEINKKCYYFFDTVIEQIENKNIVFREFIKEDVFEMQYKNQNNLGKNFLDKLNPSIEHILDMCVLSKNDDNIENIKKYIDKIQRNIIKIFDNISEISNQKDQDLEYQTKPFNFENMLANISNKISNICATKNQIFQIKLDIDLPSYIIGNENELSKIIYMLLIYATDALSDGGKLQVEIVQANKTKSNCIIQINISYVNNKHLKTHKIVDDNILNICEKMSKNAKMHLDVYTNENIGTTFSLNLNLDIFESKLTQKKLIPGINIQNLSVLLVDSSDKVCKNFKSIMENFKVNCDTTQSYLGFLDKIEIDSSQSKPFNIIFLDKNTISIDTLAIIKIIKDKFKSTIVVLLSEDEYYNKDQYIDAGVEHFITKPIFPSLLLDFINEITSIPNILPNNLKISKEYYFEKKCILIVEDAAINRNIISNILIETGVSIYYASNSDIALKMFWENYEKLDLILMDIDLPDHNGFELTKKIRNITINKAKNIPIIALTANAFEENMQKYFQNGINDHISKPLNSRIFLEKLKYYLISKKNNQDESSFEKYIDLKEALQRLRGNEQAYKNLLSNFVKNNNFENINESLIKKDFQKAKKQIHSIKGIAANLSLIKLYKVLNILEHEILSKEYSMFEVAQGVLKKTLICIEQYLKD